MNRLSDIIEMGGNLYEEAWNNGRREALKEVNGGKYEMIEEANRNLGAQIDNYEKIRYAQDEEIRRLKAELAKAEDEKAVLQAKVDSYDGVSREQSTEVVRLKEQVRRYEEQLNMLHELRQKLEDENQKTAEKLEKAQQENACLNAECDMLDKTAGDLRKKLEWADAKIKEQNEALAIYRVPTPRNCPFCGGPAEVHQLHKDEWYVACGNSDCPVNPETSCFDTETDAIEAWNNSYNAPKVTCDWR